MLIILIVNLFFFLNQVLNQNEVYILNSSIVSNDIEVCVLIAIVKCVII